MHRLRYDGQRFQVLLHRPAPSLGPGVDRLHLGSEDGPGDINRNHRSDAAARVDEFQHVTIAHPGGSKCLGPVENGFSILLE